MITGSSCFMPYHIHKQRPVNKEISMTREISSAAFSLTSFTNCGKSEMPVNTLAQMPIIVVLSKGLNLKVTPEVLISICRYAYKFE